MVRICFRLVIIAGLLHLMAVHLQAGSIVKPYTFHDGEPARASEVNEDFDRLYNQVNKIGAVIDIDQDNSKVGIDNEAPKERLHIGTLLTIHDGGWKVFSRNAYYGGDPEEDRYIQNATAAAMAFTDEGDILFRTAPAGNPDDIISSDAGTDWNVDTPPLVIKNGGEIGIGTSSPDHAVHIKSDNPDLFLDLNSASSSYHSTDLRFGKDGSEMARISWSKNDTNLTFLNSSDEGDEIMVFDDYGSLGVGDSDPDALLEISGGGKTIPGFMISSSDGADGDRFIVTETGQVGVNRANPRQYGNASVTLDVAGGIRSSYGMGIFRNDAWAGYGWTGDDATNWWKIGVWGDNLKTQISHNDDPKITIQSDGSIGIGVTDPIQYGAAGRTVDIKGGLRSRYGIGVVRNDGWARLTVSGNNDTDTWAFGVQGDNQKVHISKETNAKVTVQADGKFGIGTYDPGYTLEVNGTAGKPGGGTWADTSDGRLKQGVKKLPSEIALDRLCRLNGVTFVWINPNVHSPGTHVGLIAQEVESLFPEWVTEVEPAMADSALIPDGKKAKALGFPHAFNAYIIEAVKALKTRNESLEARNAELQKQLETMDSRLLNLERALSVNSEQ